MQKVVWSETVVEGGKKFDGSLVKPEAAKDYYQDTAVLAFPTPALEAGRMEEAAPKFSSSGKNPKPGQFTLARPEENAVQYVQIEFPQPFAAHAAFSLVGVVANYCKEKGVSIGAGSAVILPAHAETASNGPLPDETPNYVEENNETHQYPRHPVNGAPVVNRPVV